MNYKLLDILLCPECNSVLNLFMINKGKQHRYDIQFGILQCKNNPVHIYPIIDSIPRMLPNAICHHIDIIKKNYNKLSVKIQNIIENMILNLDQKLVKKFKHIQRSFTSEWNMLDDNDRPWGQDIETRRELFLKCLDIKFTDLANKKLLDAGCGHGEVEFALLGSGAEIFAIDLSFSVDCLQKRLNKLNKKETSLIHIIQGDIYKLPFKDRIFDYVHSAGVLHHTPNTFIGLKSIAKRVEKDGICFIEVYSLDHKNSFEKIIYYMDRFIRKITVRLSHKVLHLMCYLLAPFLWSYVVIFNYFISSKDRYIKRSLREMELSLFDNYSPLYQWHHSTNEVIDWFHFFNFKKIRKTFYNNSVIGILGKLE